MKRLYLSILLLLMATAAFSQAKKPTIMVVPSDLWCIKNGYYTEFDNMGHAEQIPDYTKALQNDENLLLVVSKVGELMAERGFPLKDLEASLKRLATEEVENSVTTSESGAALSESPLDKLRRVAKADIWIQVTWTINRTGPKSSITVNLQGKDAYTNKQVAAGSGTSAPVFTSSMELPVLLAESIESNLTDFNNQLEQHFEDLFTNGREVAVCLKRFDSSPINFESEFDYNGQTAELADIIGVWFEESTLNGRFSETERSANQLRYEQVRIPLYGKSLSGREVALDATMFVRPLANLLKKEPYNVVVKTSPKGLGEIWLILGEK